MMLEALYCGYQRGEVFVATACTPAALAKDSSLGKS
jgi:hypothetical protein